MAPNKNSRKKSQYRRCVVRIDALLLLFSSPATSVWVGPRRAYSPAKRPTDNSPVPSSISPRDNPVYRAMEASPGSHELRIYAAEQVFHSGYRLFAKAFGHAIVLAPMRNRIPHPE